MKIAAAAKIDFQKRFLSDVFPPTIIEREALSDPTCVNVDKTLLFDGGSIR
jgi:hypothetical protein